MKRILAVFLMGFCFGLNAAIAQDAAASATQSATPASESGVGASEVARCTTQPGTRGAREVAATPEEQPTGSPGSLSSATAADSPNRGATPPATGELPH